MPESTTSKDVGGLSGQTQAATSDVSGKPEGMTEQEWQEKLAEQNQQGSPQAGNEGSRTKNVSGSQISSHTKS